MKSNHQTKPRARKQGLVVQALPDETLVYDLDRDRAHCLNETASLVWRRCDGRTTTKEIALSLTKSLKQPVDEKIVWLALDQLGRNHLLTDVPTRPAALQAMSRREMVRALSVTAAVVIPVVASIVAPTPAQASSCFQPGQPCTASAQCCTGLCNGGCCGSCP